MKILHEYFKKYLWNYPRRYKSINECSCHFCNNCFRNSFSTFLRDPHSPGIDYGFPSLSYHYPGNHIEIFKMQDIPKETIKRVSRGTSREESWKEFLKEFRKQFLEDSRTPEEFAERIRWSPRRHLWWNTGWSFWMNPRWNLFRNLSRYSWTNPRENYWRNSKKNLRCNSPRNHQRNHYRNPAFFFFLRNHGMKFRKGLRWNSGTPAGIPEAFLQESR